MQLGRITEIRSFFNAWWLHGIQLMSVDRVEEAHVALWRAAQLSNALSIHVRYWRAIQGLTDLAPEEKQAANRE